jgi:hypothetical protein
MSTRRRERTADSLESVLKTGSTFQIEYPFGGGGHQQQKKNARTVNFRMSVAVWTG